MNLDLIKTADRKKIEEYQEFVMFCIKKFGKMSNLVRGDEIDPNELNLALGSYLKVTEGLLSEYQSSKIASFYIELDYDEWYSVKFEECKAEVISDYSSHNEGVTRKTDQVKPSIKEYNNRVQFKYKEEMRAWKEKVMLAEYEKRFILRLLETLKKYDNILTTLSNNMRQEMRTLSTINRANLSDPGTVSTLKIRGDFPDVDKKRKRIKSQ